MSTATSKRMDQRPYTVGTFQKRLNEFDEFIKEITLQDVEATPEERRQMITENLRYDQFCDSIRALFGEDIRNQDLKSIYRKISTNPDAKVDWSELFGYFQSTDDDQDLASGEDVSVFMVSARRRVGEAAGDRKRRDTVQCIQYIPSMDCYLTASQKGAISIWTNKLRLQSCTDINESAWVTGCDYLPILRRVACCTERSLAIWDNRAKGKAQPIFIIKPLEHSPQCMTWVPRSNTANEDCLLFGDDQGYVNLLTLSAKDLTVKTTKGDGNNKRFATSHVIDPKKLSIPMQRRRLHDDWVLKIKYFPDLRCFASCSPSSTESFLLEEVDRITDQGEVRRMAINKGVNAFAYCARSNIIATGGVDKVIRVWHPHISRQTGQLIGHLFTIVDIECNEKDQHIISLSTARVFRVWDIHTLTSLQVFTDNEERPGEKRIYSTMFDNRHDLLLTGSSVLDAWPLTRAVQDTMQVPHTHDRPITLIRYNRELNQVVTVCNESVVRVWETDTGKQVYHIPAAHGANVEVTAITLDQTGYRLASGAFDGSVKVWDFGSGQEIKCTPGKAAADEDMSIVDMRYVTHGSERYLLAIGWNNRICIIMDSNDSNELQERREFSDIYYMTRCPSQSSEHLSDPFRSQQPLPDIGDRNSQASPIRPGSVFRKDHVLTGHEMTCMAVLPSANLVVTGCTNGDLIMWNTQKAAVETLFRLRQTGGESPRDSNGSVKQKQDTPVPTVNMADFLVHCTRKLDPAFIKKLTYHTSQEDVNDTSATDLPDIDEKKHEVVDGESQEALDDSFINDDEGGESEDLRDDAEEEEKYKDGYFEDLTDPDANMIVTTYEPVVVTCHQDAFIRFWDLQGHLLREMTAQTRRHGSAVTAVCHDQDCNLLMTGDHRGYITLWDVGKFLENPTSEKQGLIKQLLCWRAHLTKISQLAYLDSLKAIVSGSTDGSARIWWGTKGRFVGFYGQHRALQWPTSEEMSATPVLPYDINEGPLAPVKTISARQKIQASQKLECPLIFTWDNWKKFRKSAAHHRQKNKKREPEDKKFFGALIKPRPYNHHLECQRSGEMRSGAVFRALPIYTVRTPVVPKTPEISYPHTEDTPLHVQLANSNKGGKPESKAVSIKEPKDKVNVKTKQTKKIKSQAPTYSVLSPRRR